MPILAIGAAALAVSSVSISAIAAGSLSAIFTGVAAVGATLGAIGEVAGVKELKTAGLVLGGIGGVGALANAVGAFGANATIGSVLGGAEATASGNAGQTAASLMNGAADTTASDLMSGFTGGGFESANVVDAANHIGGFAMDFGTDPLSSAVRVPGVSNTTQDIARGASDALKPVTDNIVEGPTVADNTPAEPAAKPGSTDLSSTVTGKVDGAKQPQQPASGGLFGKDGFFNTLGGMGVVQAAGSFLSGAFDPLKPAQAEAYKAQAAANNAAAALQNKQNSNMNEPIPVARRVPVTGRVGGLMNSTPGAMV